MTKDSSRTTAEEFQKIVESWGQKTFKQIVKQPLHHHMCLGRGFMKNYPSSSKNNLQHIQLSDTTGTSNGTGFYGQIKRKNIFLAAITQDRFGEHRDKKYPVLQ